MWLFPLQRHPPIEIWVVSFLSHRSRWASCSLSAQGPPAAADCHRRLVAAHGGVVSIHAIEKTDVYLQFGGGCQGCGQIDVTLKQGIEVMLKESIPEISNVYDATDHAGGTNPYFQ